MIVTFKRTHLWRHMGKGILNKFPSVDKSSPLLPNLNVFSGLSGISMLIFCHTQSVIFVISETGGFYNGFSRQQGGHKTKSNKATSVQYTLTSPNWKAPSDLIFCKYSFYSSWGGWLSRKLFFSLSENLASSAGKYYRNSAFPTLCKNIQSVEIQIMWDAIGWRVLCSVKTWAPLMRRRTHVELQFGQPRFRSWRIHLTF